MDNLGSASRLAPRLNRNFSLYHQIEAILLEQIVTGEFAPGTQLPTEKELCDLYHVSRPTVRQALGEAAAATPQHAFSASGLRHADQVVVGFGVEYRDAGTQRIVVGGMVGFGAEGLQFGRHVPGDGGPGPGGVASMLAAGTHGPALEGKGRA